MTRVSDKAVVLPLIERLDAETGQALPRLGRPAMERYRESVLADLRQLLGSRSRLPADTAPDSADESGGDAASIRPAATILGYGMPHPGTLDFSNARDRRAFADRVKRCIETFERRLIDVEVECAGPSPSNPACQQVQVRARLRPPVEAMPVDVTGLLDPVSGEIELSVRDSRA
jgi:type VI secretion system lysozyme-like protein